MRYIIMFPGQGAQHVDMGRDFYENFPIYRESITQASEAVGHDLYAIITKDPKRLGLTAWTQPCLLATSIGMLRVLEAEFGLDRRHIHYAAGHSLGEITALCAANVITLEKAALLTHHRGSFMQDAVENGVGGMAALTGRIHHDALRDVVGDVNKQCAEDIGDGVWLDIANDNADGQIVLSGHHKAIELFQQHKNAANIGYRRVTKLSVSAPFHSRYMRDAATRFAAVLNDRAIDFKNPDFPIISNISPNVVEKDPSILKGNVIKAIESAVRWREIMQTIYQDSDTIKASGDRVKVIEIGPSSVLTGLMKRSHREVDAVSVNTIETANSIKESK